MVKQKLLDQGRDAVGAGGGHAQAPGKGITEKPPYDATSFSLTHKPISP